MATISDGVGTWMGARLKDGQPGGMGNAGIPGQPGPHHTMKPCLRIKHTSDINSFFNLQILSSLQAGREWVVG